MAFVPDNCANCDRWDNSYLEGQTHKWHAAVDHVYNARRGMRGGYHVDDRWCSSTTSPPQTPRRARGGGTLHVISVKRSASILNLRWAIHEVPHLDDQCSACTGLFRDQPQ